MFVALRVAATHVISVRVFLARFQARASGVFSYAFRSGMFHGLNQIARHHNSLSGPIAKQLWYALPQNLMAESL
jgi:hypothetical protein